MEKINSLIICLLLISSCNYQNNKETLLLEKSKKKTCFDIDYIGYWGLQNGDSLPMSILKIDTIFNIGFSINFNEYGDTAEKTILIDRSKAYKTYYIKNKPYLSNIVYYKLKKNHSKKNLFSISCYDYGFRTELPYNSWNEISFVKNKSLDGPSISFYTNMKIKEISYYKDGNLDGVKLIFDSITGAIITKKVYKYGEQIK